MPPAGFKLKGWTWREGIGPSYSTHCKQRRTIIKREATMALCGDDHDHKKLLTRIRRIDGQVNGITRMIEEDRDCLDVLKQIAAASGALRSLGMVLMEDHLKGCVAKAIMNEDREQEDQLIHQVVEIFNKFSK